MRAEKSQGSGLLFLPAPSGCQAPTSIRLAPTLVPSLPPPPCSNHISGVTAPVSTCSGSINLSSIKRLDSGPTSSQVLAHLIHLCVSQAVLGACSSLLSPSMTKEGELEGPPWCLSHQPGHSKCPLNSQSEVTGPPMSHSLPCLKSQRLQLPSSAIPAFT